MADAIMHFWSSLAQQPDPALPTDVVRGQVGIVGGYYSALACWLAGCLWPRERIAAEWQQ